MILNKVKQIFKILPKSLKWKLVILQVLLILTSILELCGIGGIMPFVAIVTHPQIVMKYKLSAEVFNYFNINSPKEIIIFSGGLLLLLFLIVNASKMTIMFIAMKINLRVKNVLTTALFKYYMHKDYLFHTKNNSATLRSKVFFETARISIIFNSLTSIFSSGLLAFLIGTTIFYVNPVLALTVGAILILFYLAVYTCIRVKIKKNGIILSEVTYLNSKVINEAFNGIRDSKLLGKELLFTDKIKKGTYAVDYATKANLLISSFPRNMLEVLCIALMVGITVIFITTGKNINTLLPILSLYAIAAYKLMPTIQIIFSAFTNIREKLVAFDKIWEDLKPAIKQYELKNSVVPAKLTFNDNIKLSNINFSYDESQPVLKNLDLTINKNTSVGFVGSSGSGKITLLDLILGFLTPDSGEIFIDRVSLNKTNLPAWRKRIGFVSQMIFLSDSSIAENIAFGEFGNEIDMERVKKAAHMANIHDFVIDQPDRYNSLIGESGVQLSGGQRQRIGIARALYHEPDVLIFDEATSALDGVTESAIIDAVHKFSHNKTIIMIAHRITTLKDCDIIYFLDKGKIADSGTYEELLYNNDHFRKMAKI